MTFENFLETAYLIPLMKRLPFVAAVILIFCILCRSERMQKFMAFIERRSHWVLAAVVFLALGLRMAWGEASPVSFAESYQNTSVPQDESSLMNIYAVHISQIGLPYEADGTLSTRRPVGYPYLLGFLYKIFGYHARLFEIVQTILSALLVVVFYVLGMKIFSRRLIALAAAAGMAFYPLNIISTNIILDEFPFFLFLFAAVCLYAENLNKRTVRHTLAIGILLGLATLCRTHALVIPIVFVPAYLLYRLPLHRVLLQTVLCTAMIFAVSAPWALATFKAFGRPCFFTANGTAVFYSTLNDKASWHNGYFPLTEETGGNRELLNEKNPIKAVAIAEKLAMQWVITHPLQTLKWMVMRNAVLFGFHLDDMVVDLTNQHAVSAESFAVKQVHTLRKILSWTYTFNALFAVLGTAALLFSRRYFFYRQSPAFVLILLIVFYWMVLHGLFFGMRKYRWLCDLLFFYPAGFFFFWLKEKAAAMITPQKESQQDQNNTYAFEAKNGDSWEGEKACLAGE